MFGDFRLEVFMALVSAGNFTRAAESLGISQPAVSQNIAELEKSLGARLFERSRGEVTLTPQGRIFMEYARNILHWYASAQSMFALDTDSTMSVRIEAGPEFLPFIVPRLLSSLHAVCPRMRVDVAAGDVSGLHDMAFPDGSVRKADLRLFSVPDSASVRGKCLCPVSFAVVAAPSSSHQKHYHATLADFVPHIAVWDDGVCDMRDALGADVMSGTVLHSSSIDVVKAYVASSPESVGVLPLCAVTDELRNGILVRIPVPRFKLERLACMQVSPEFAASSLCVRSEQVLSEILCAD